MPSHGLWNTNVSSDEQGHRNDSARDARLVPVRAMRRCLHRVRITMAKRVRSNLQRKIRDELLAAEKFTILLEAKIMAEDFRQHYNQQRPHSSLNYQTPEEFTLNWHYNNPGLKKSLAH